MNTIVITKPLCLMSFDIGIKNLSYAMITSENDKVVIKDWKILDISKDESTIDVALHKCSCVKSKNKKNQENQICGKKAKFEKLGTFYCEIHAKATTDFLIPSKEIEQKSLNKLRKIELFDLGIKYHILTEENRSENKKEIMDKLFAFFLVKCFVPIKLIKNVNASDINLITLGRNMKRMLDEVPYLDQVTHIILENQISTIASRMKTIQGMLAQYFISKLDTSVHIQFVSSLNKLKLYAPRTDIEETNDKYKRHKQDAIYHTTKILENNILLSSWLQVFYDSKKRDDLSDSLLQGIWFLSHIKYLTINETYSLTKN
jgi:hypothetical protein